MGQSADAKLAFGFDLGSEEDIPEHLREFDIDKAAKEEAGLIEPAQMPGPKPYDSPEWSAYFQSSRRAREAYPIEILYHGYEFSGWFVAIKKSVTKAYWENPVKAAYSVITVEEIELLKKFCEKYDIEYKEPAWHLMAHYA